MHRYDFYDDVYSSSSIILQRIVTHKKLYRRCLQNSRINIINNVNSFKNQHSNQQQQQHNGDKSSAVRTNNNNNINNHNNLRKSASIPTLTVAANSSTAQNISSAPISNSGSPATAPLDINFISSVASNWFTEQFSPYLSSSSSSSSSVALVATDNSSSTITSNLLATASTRHASNNHQNHHNDTSDSYQTPTKSIEEILYQALQSDLLNDSNNHSTNRRENANNTNDDDDDDDDDDEVYLNDDFNNYHDNNCNKVRIVEPYIPIDIVESSRIIMNMNIQNTNDNESSSSVRNILNEKDYLVYLNTLSTIILSIEQVIKIYKKVSDDFLLYSNKVRQESVNSVSITPTKGSSSSSDGSIQLIVQLTSIIIH